MGKRIPLATRFWAKVVESGECWLWTGSTDKMSGYGRIRIDRSTKYVHRVSYELMVGDIPEGLHLDHLCRNRACVNPYHLDPVTSGVNTRRSPITHGNETHCPAGHAYEGDNLAIYAGRRNCRTCNIARCRAFYEARRAA